LKYFFNIPSKS